MSISSRMAYDITENYYVVENVDAFLSTFGKKNLIILSLSCKKSLAESFGIFTRIVMIFSEFIYLQTQ